MKAFLEIAIAAAMMTAFVFAIIMTDDTQPHEKNARERGELQASFYTPKPTIIEGE